MNTHQGAIERFREKYAEAYKEVFAREVLNKGNQWFENILLEELSIARDEGYEAGLSFGESRTKEVLREAYERGVKEGEGTKNGVQRYQMGYVAGQFNERAFILNVLDGIDAADEQMGNTGGGTKAIRFALQSRVIGDTRLEGK